MNKVIEYMYFGLPVVAFDLHETRVSAAEAGVYAEANSEHALAAAMHACSTTRHGGRRWAQIGRRGCARCWRGTIRCAAAGRLRPRDAGRRQRIYAGPFQISEPAQ